MKAFLKSCTALGMIAGMATQALSAGMLKEVGPG